MYINIQKSFSLVNIFRYFFFGYVVGSVSNSHWYQRGSGPGNLLQCGSGSGLCHHTENFSTPSFSFQILIFLYPITGKVPALSEFLLSLKVLKHGNVGEIFLKNQRCENHCKIVIILPISWLTDPQCPLGSGRTKSMRNHENLDPKHLM